MDPSFGNAAYTRFFDPSGFKQPASPCIQHSQLFQLLQLFGRHLRAMAEARQQGFLPISEIARALAQPGFVAYYQPDWSEDERFALLNELRQLSGQQVLYIDMDLQIFEDLKDECRCMLLPILLKPHFALLRKLATIDSLQAMIDLFDEPDALMIKQLCSEEELDNTDILHKYYERLDNFRMAEKLGLVKDWKHIYDTKDSALAADIWQLWLDSLQTARIKDNTATPRPIYDYSSLFDTRNLSFDEVIVLNSIEGQLPQNPEPVWLFNERQLERMKLKHYDLIRKWERYYFLRLLLSSSTVYLYAYRDGEKDLEPGSYFTELSHFLAEESNWSQVRRHTTSIQVKDEILGMAQRELAKEHDKAKWLSEAGIKNPASDIESFLRLPCEGEKDFGGQFRSSYYGLNRLISNPFAWYIQYKAGLKECELLPEETVSPMLFGNIMHSFLGKALHSIKGEQSDINALEPAFARQELTQKLEGILQSKEYLYKIPKNYNLDFLNEVMLQLLVSSVRAFYDKWLKPRLEGKSFRIIPEEVESQRDQEGYKTLLSFGKGDRYVLKVKGRADLQVNTPETDYIIDFKTGGADTEQLLFYEFYYHRHDEAYDRELKSLFWMVKEDKSEIEGVKKQDVYNDWISYIAVTLMSCLEAGYRIGITAADRKYMETITRADLYRHQNREAQQ
ncbi:MAG: PD-(D/E)XK nuclease family protein [Candidatus Cloacimonetes bacterium]|nr:PD-(D/E)XK nuclease family protein [Candidatus Cloacimonadota bacterium]